MMRSFLALTALTLAGGEVPVDRVDGDVHDVAVRVRELRPQTAPRRLIGTGRLRCLAPRDDRMMPGP
jgi:hypothetical protein